MKSHINFALILRRIAIEQGIIADTAEEVNVSNCGYTQQLSGDKVSEDMNMSICDSTQLLSGDKLSDDFPIPSNIKPTVLKNGYYMVVLCLCWLLHNKGDCEKRYLKIKNLATLNSTCDIFKCLNDIVKGNDHGRSLLANIKGIRPIVFAASVSIISDLKGKGKIIPHKFSVARNFDSTRLQVEIKGMDEDFRSFNVYDYEILRTLYPMEGDKFNPSKAITSLFTDVVLYCFEDWTPNLHMVSSGSKQDFVHMIDVGELEFDTSDGTRKKLKEIYRKLDISGVEPCARSAAFLLKYHKYFKLLYLNDADQRFYNFLRCVKEYPLYVISEILVCNSDEELNKLRKAAKKESKARPQAKDRGKTLGKLPDGSSLVKIRNFMEEHCNKFAYSVRDRVSAAAWLFLWVNMSFSGNFDSGISKDRIYIPKLHSMLSEVLSASLVLQKAEISCEDCIDFTRRFKDNKINLIFADPPYVLEFGSACKTYSIRVKSEEGKSTIKALKPFGIEKIKELFDLLTTVKGRVLITHSNEHEVNLAAYCRDIDYLFSYYNKANGCNEDGYETVVFSKNIHEEGFVRKKKVNEALKVIFNKRNSDFRKLKEDIEDSSEELANTRDDTDLT